MRLETATPSDAKTNVDSRLGALIEGRLPENDEKTLDELIALRGRKRSQDPDPKLAAIALKLASLTGTNAGRPLAALHAWKILDSESAAEAAKEAFETIVAFTEKWKETGKGFLILENAEIDLIELLFETLDPERDAELMLKAMNFKFLSGRRLGLVRRIAARLRSTARSTCDREKLLAAANVTSKFLATVENEKGIWQPIVIEAAKANEICRGIAERIEASLRSSQTIKNAPAPLSGIIPVTLPERAGAQNQQQKPLAVAQSQPPMPALVAQSRPPMPAPVAQSRPPMPAPVAQSRPPMPAPIAKNQPPKPIPAVERIAIF
jgi:hypothetical protein